MPLDTAVLLLRIKEVVFLKKFKVSVDKELCIGCAACTTVCDNFVMEGDKAKPKKAVISEKEFACNKEGENVCPVSAIKVVEEK